MPYPETSEVAAGENILASQYNNLRKDALYPVYQDFMYGETIAVNNAVFLGTGDEVAEGIQTNVTNMPTDLSSVNVRSNEMCGQVITTSSVTLGSKKAIVRATLRLDKSGAANGTPVILSVREIDGNGRPKATELATASVMIEDIPTGAPTNIVFPYFNKPIVFNPSTQYAIVLRYPNSDVYVRWYRGNGNTYAGGYAVFSNNSGETWTVNSDIDLKFILEERETTIAGRVYRASARWLNSGIHNFLGFAKESGSVTNVRKVQLGGIIEGLSGLTSGKFYYLSDTQGAIALTSGRFPFIVGISISTSTVLILEAPKRLYLDNFQGGSVSYTVTTSPTLQWSNDTTRSTQSLTLVKLKEIQLNENLPRVRLTWDMRTTNSSHTVFTRIYLNGSPISVEYSTNFTSFTTITLDLANANFVVGDLIQIFGRTSNALGTLEVRNMRFSFDRRMTKISHNITFEGTGIALAGFEIPPTNQDPY